MSKNIALVIIYNHQFNKNIEILNLIYKERFDYVYHLVPFYKDAVPNVISISENSYRFHGYLAQSWGYLFNSKCDSFVFIADDLLLAPALNGQSIHAELGLDSDDSFIDAHCFNELEKPWVHSRKALDFFKNAAGSEGYQYLPSALEAKDSIIRQGLNYQPFMNSKALVDADSGLLYPMPYPLVYGYADFFIVPAKDIELLAYYCGIFSSMNLFVEIALPTALAFSASKLRTKTLNYFSGAMWNAQEIDDLRDKHDGSLTNLMGNFPDKKIYLHPIKLSKWNN